MGKREVSKQAEAVSVKSGKKGKILAGVFYALSLAVYVAVTIWRFSLEGESDWWKYFPVVIFAILPLSAFLTSALMGYCKSFLFWLSPVVQVALLFLYELIAFRGYATWPRIILMAAAALIGIIVGLVLKMLHERGKSEKRRKKQQDLAKAEQEKAVGEALKEFTEEKK